MFSLLVAATLCAGAVWDLPALGQTDTDGHDHQHGELRDTGDPAPNIDIKAHHDGDGYNLQIVTTHFRFSPENTGQRTGAVEGHAHLYVNGVKRARVYGAWFHLPGDWLIAGENTVRVSLNDNVHKIWAVGGKVVEASLTLVKGGGFTGKVIEARLGDGSPETFHARQGEAVRMVLHADEETTLHLHGYDMMAVAAPDAPAVFAFEALHAGRFAIEAHGVEDLLGRTDKALAYIEVSPE